MEELTLFETAEEPERTGRKRQKRKKFPLCIEMCGGVCCCQQQFQC